MMGPINADGDDWAVAFSREEAFEFAMGLREVASQYPDCDLQIDFTDEDGTLKWVVKACPVQSGEASDEQEE